MKRGAVLMTWTCVAFTGRERKVVYSETQSTHVSLLTESVSIAYGGG